KIEPLDLGIGDPGRVEVAGETYDSDVRHARITMPGQGGSDGFFVARFTKLAAVEPEEPLRTNHWGKGKMEAGPEGGVQGVVSAYELEHEVLSQANTVSSPRKLYATTIQDLDEVMALGPDRVGCYLATKEPGADRLAFDAATSFGRDAGRAHELSVKEARSWLAGNGVHLDEPIPWSVITCQEEPIGCARAFGDELPCYVPKVRRVAEEGDLLGFLSGSAM
ncbi:MAG: hypothetical protein R3185_09175, partial [Candidatus Thermoplasmatota archaeon]|nr:hypothetical protein [Candidatus Thermoplasmatota archaeon]